MLLKAVFEASAEGGYTAFVPALPGCISEGDTLEKARQNIREAIGEGHPTTWVQGSGFSVQRGNKRDNRPAPSRGASGDFRRNSIRREA